MEDAGPGPGDPAGKPCGAAGRGCGQLAEALGPSRPGGTGEPPPHEDEVGHEETPTDVEIGSKERYYRLDGIVFRVRLDRLDQGASYLRNGSWVWTPITSGSVIHNPNARELLGSEAAKFRSID